MDFQEIKDKVEWEGGVFAALEYGVRSEDFDESVPDEFKDLWYEAENAFLNFAYEEQQVTSYLEDVDFPDE